MNQTAEITLEKHHDLTGAKIGMWLFLFTELLLFGGLFLLYAVYLKKHPEEFHYASSQLNQFVGAMNTIILLTSSLTMVLSVTAFQKKSRGLAKLFLVITILLALAFLVNKYFEWGHKISHGIYPNSQVLLGHPRGEILFYGLYYVMTGLHGLHVIIGIIIMSFMLYFISKKSTVPVNLAGHVLPQFSGRKLLLSDDRGNRIWESDKIDDSITGVEVRVRGVYTEEEDAANEIKLENAGLYWHLVDIIWIFLFPLFYLIAM